MAGSMNSSGNNYHRRQPLATRLPRRRRVSPLLAFVLVAATALLSSLRTPIPSSAVFVMATDEAGTEYLANKASEEGVVSLASGLNYKVLASGNGTQHPTVDSPCLCHYAGTLIDGTPFDSSYSRGKPSTFAPNQVIRGWTEALQLMVEGDKWEVYLPSDLAYGSSGSPPDIPGDAALVFTIELIEIQGDSVPLGANAGKAGAARASWAAGVVGVLAYFALEDFL